MFPIRDHNPSDRTPYVTYALIAANLLVFLSYFHLFSNERALTLFFFEWGMLPARLTQGDGYYTLLTSMFLHGGILHLAGNLLFLWIFGDNLEDEMGHVPFLLFYLATGATAAIGQWIASPLSTVPTVGASGAIAGVMGGYLLLFPRARVDVLVIIFIFFRVFAVPAWLMLGIWFAIQLVAGFGADANMGGVAYWAHAVGFGAGFVLTLPYWLRRGGTAYWQRNEGHPPHPGAQYELTTTRVPRVRRRR